MLGTIINSIAIIVGGIIGLAAKKAINPTFEKSINKALGLAVLILGINGVISSMFTIKDGKLASGGELLLIISLVLGTFIGEALHIDEHLAHFASKLERKCGTSGFAASFVNGTLIYCVGAMAIIGALNDGLRGDISVLLTKSLLDGISSVVLGATLGGGVIFTAIPVFIYQGSITLLAGLLQPYLTSVLLNNLCAVGFALVLCIGFNFIADTKIKTANMLPALPVVLLLSLIPNLPF